MSSAVRSKVMAKSNASCRLQVALLYYFSDMRESKVVTNVGNLRKDVVPWSDLNKIKKIKRTI